MATTAWSEIVTSALTYIDDVRLTEDLQANPALFLRKMSMYVKGAIPLCNRPPEFYAYLMKDITEPTYTDYVWASTTASMSSQTTLNTGITGYELCCCSTRYVDVSGEVVMTPYTDFTYDSETGNVVMAIQSSTGIEYTFDFYNDGEVQELDARQMRMVALALALVWDERFERNWLNLQMKIKDQSFSTVNESNYMEKSNARLMDNTQRFNDEIRKYEQDIAYDATVKNVRVYR